MHRLTVGAMSKPSSDLPDLRGALLQQRTQLGDVLGREQRGDPSVGDLAGERGVLRPNRRQVDGDALLNGGDGQLERLARPVGQRQLERLAVEVDALARQRHANHRDVLARALQLLGEALPVPALGHLRPGRADAADHATVGQLVDRRRGHRGHRRASGRASGICPSRGGWSTSAQPASRARSPCPSHRPQRPTPSHSPGARPPGRFSADPPM